jgi:hypothetical protein
VTRLESDYYAYMGYDPDNTREGLRHYLPWLQQSPVLELAPGRGEMLGLLREAGVTAYGVDIDEGMVEQGRAEGFDVRLADAVAGLREAGEATGSSAPTSSSTCSPRSSPRWSASPPARSRPVATSSPPPPTPRASP